ncbi:hypothetical protein MG293_017778 [Ovis ammon polii]|uniref:Uncharacterized protein n=1 Tax=Ovis ammon polii TaxID=230172 RepID=A0AAD4Y2S7_OVIAM|nr:hypothetical protein MG293_017778 [Ovis ammon polii]
MALAAASWDVSQRLGRRRDDWTAASRERRTTKIYSSSFLEEFQGCVSNIYDPRTLTDGLWGDLLKEDPIHCFTGSYRVVKPLLELFSTMSVGFTAVLTCSSAQESWQAVREIPLERIVMESDAPHFLTRQVPRSIRQCAHPGLALRTVREMARVKVLSLSHTLATLRENACRLCSL